MMSENSRQPVLMSWIHSHVQGVKCNFSSVDLHTQHTFAKVYENILGLVVELTEAGQVEKYDFFEMSIEGKLSIEKCSRKKNCQPRLQHESCKNDSYYKSSIENVIFHDDTSLDCRNFMNGRIEASNQSFASPMHLVDSSFSYLDNNDKVSKSDDDLQAKPSPSGIHSILYQTEDIIEEGNYSLH